MHYLPYKPHRYLFHDYRLSGAYFVTICTWEKRLLFGRISHGTMILNPLGASVDRFWRAIPDHFPNVILGAYAIMPNHVHGIIQIVERDIPVITAQHAAPLRPARITQRQPPNRPNPAPGSLGTIVRGFKSALTKNAHTLPEYKRIRIWQQNFYDHIIRNDKDWSRIHSYILANPDRWTRDRNYGGAKE